MTLEQVANIFDSKISTIAGWETGDRSVDLDDVAKLAIAYNVHPAMLLFAPPGGSEFEQLRRASEALRAMAPEDAEDWLRMGRRLARAEPIDP